MRKNKIIVKWILPVLCVSGIFFTSCQKFLQEDPHSDTTLITADAFGSVDSAFQVVLGAYNALAGDQGYGIRVSLYFPMGTDEAMNPGDGLDNGRRSISRYDLSASNSEISRPFTQMYKGIELTNVCIDNIPNMVAYSGGQGAEKQKEARRLYGEVLTLRAQFYLDLIKLWGDVPAPMIPAAKNLVSYPQKEDRDLVYDKLLADLELAKGLLPWWNEVTPDERITKSAAMALRAKVALFRAGYSLRRSPVQMMQGSNPETYYTIARDECKALMDSGKNALAPSFKDLFKNNVCGVKTPIDPTGELIFQIAMAGGSSIADSKMGYACGPKLSGAGNAFVLIMPTAFYQYDSTDLRRDVSIAPYDVKNDGITKTGVGLGALRDGKFRRDWIAPAVDPNSGSQYWSINWPLIRYSDVLLMYAEAQNELNGPTADAVEAVNMVRRRGFGKPINSADITVDIAPAGKQQLFDAIVKERLLEFMGEGLRKYDLIRWNLLATKIQETKDNMNKLRDHVAPYDQLPLYMYYDNAATADNSTIWLNSFYNPGPVSGSDPTKSTTIPGYTSVKWTGGTQASADPRLPLNVLIIERYATNFIPNHNELFPIFSSDITNGKLTQDYGY